MPMLLLTLSAAAAASAAAPPRTPPLDPARCASPTARQVAARERMRVRPLGDMPPARQYLGVLRTIDHCPVPAVVREEVGRPRR